MFRNSGVASWVPGLLLLSCAVALGTPTSPGGASGFERGQQLFDEGKYPEAIEFLGKECAENPANEAARVLLAQAYERAGDSDKAESAWTDLLSLSRIESNQELGRKALSRIQRIKLDKSDTLDAEKGTRTDPFKIPMPEVDWKGLEVIEDSKYLPPRYPPPVNFELPPFVNETKHFTVYSTNERLSKVVGERAEIYLDFMTQKLFGGRAWAVRFPLLVYSTIDDYNKHGGPVGSGGVTYGHVTGKTQVIIIFQLKPDFRQSKKGSSRGSGTEIWKYGIESVLPHELTHAVINEFFGGQRIPRWLHEAVAGRFEQTRDHYGEAARLARQVVAGEFFRMRDLFDQKVYPQRVAQFYEQAADVVLYLFEAGPTAMHAFLGELAAGRGHDAACAAALGIPEQGAVEEFERRWVEWMRIRYIKDLDNSKDKTVESSADKTKNALTLPWVNELETVAGLAAWRDIDMGSMQSFKTMSESKEAWGLSGGILTSKPAPGQGASLLGIRMNETAPVAITFDVKFLGNPTDPLHRVGLAQMDSEGSDTRVEVSAPLRDTSTHKVVAIWSDDLAIYLDGTCTGRYAAMQIGGNAQDVDYPLALVSYGPVEIQNLRVAAIKSFSDKPVVAQADEKSKDQPGTPADQPGSSRRRRRGEP